MILLIVSALAVFYLYSFQQNAIKQIVIFKLKEILDNEFVYQVSKQHSTPTITLTNNEKIETSTFNNQKTQFHHPLPYNRVYYEFPENVKTVTISAVKKTKDLTETTLFQFVMSSTHSNKNLLSVKIFESVHIFDNIVLFSLDIHRTNKEFLFIFNRYQTDQKKMRIILSDSIVEANSVSLLTKCEPAIEKINF